MRFFVVLMYGMIENLIGGNRHCRFFCSSPLSDSYLMETYAPLTSYILARFACEHGEGWWSGAVEGRRSLLSLGRRR